MGVGFWGILVRFRESDSTGVKNANSSPLRLIKSTSDTMRINILWRNFPERDAPRSDCLSSQRVEQASTRRLPVCVCLWHGQEFSGRSSAVREECRSVRRRVPINKTQHTNRRRLRVSRAHAALPLGTRAAPNAINALLPNAMQSRYRVTAAKLIKTFVQIAMAGHGWAEVVFGT
jgi:hypothetical protein